MSKEICSTCQHYQPLEIENWGTCDLAEIWATRAQEVRGDRQACAERGSHWVGLDETAPASTGQPDISSAPSSAPQSPAARPSWVSWLPWLGGAGLVLSIPLFCVDLFVGIPGIPEFAIVLFLISLALMFAGNFWDQITATR